jgi:tetratricopeptide (TPR) repeat protein
MPASRSNLYVAALWRGGRPAGPGVARRGRLKRRPTGAPERRLVPAVLLSGLIAIFASGCGVFRCQKSSDEAITAARQMSLQGIDAQQRGQWDQAETLFASAVARCPRDERARGCYAESLWQRGATDEAISHMEEAARLSGHDPQRLVQLGQMYRSRGELHRAGQQAERAIAADPQLAAAWALQGEVLQAQGKRSEALASFHRALSYQEHYPEVQLAIAEIYSQENRPQRALATLHALAAHYPPGQGPIEVLVREGFALRQLGRHHDAARTLARAAEQGNPSAELLYELATAQIAAGDHAAARLAVAAGLDREPHHAGCLALQADLGAPSAVLAAALPARETVTR